MVDSEIEKHKRRKISPGRQKVSRYKLFSNKLIINSPNEA